MIRPRKVTQVPAWQHGHWLVAYLRKNSAVPGISWTAWLVRSTMALCYSMYVARVFSYPHVQTVMHIVISLVYSHMIGTDTLSRSVDWSVAPCLPMTTLVWGSFRLTPNIHTQSYS